MNKSEDIKQLIISLIKCRKEISKIPKSAENPFFKSSYAPLPEIIEAIEDKLLENGLMILQFPVGENELETIVVHESGQWISRSFYMKPTKDDPQAYGSVITYQRRYALGAVLLLNIDEDDDGNLSSSPNESKDNRPWLSETQFNLAKKRIEEGEDILDNLKREFRMKKVYREQLEKL